jgi:hypothetical protein
MTARRAGPPPDVERAAIRRALLKAGDSVDSGDQVAAEVRLIADDARMLDVLASVVNREFFVRWCERQPTPIRTRNRQLANFERAVSRSLTALDRLPMRNRKTEEWSEALRAMVDAAHELQQRPRDPRKDDTARRQRFVGWVLYVLLHRGPTPDHPRGTPAVVAEALCNLVRYPFPEDDKNRRLILREAFRGLEDGGVRIGKRPTKRARSSRVR